MTDELEVVSRVEKRTTNDPDAKMGFQRITALICSEHGIVGYNTNDKVIRNGGILEAHQQFHRAMAKTGDNLVDKMRRASAARTKMASTSQCQCPCTDHTGCVPEDRDTVYTFTEEQQIQIEGLPKALVICGPCKDYWNWRLSQLQEMKDQDESSALDDPYGEVTQDESDADA